MKSCIFWWHNLFIDTETLLFIRIFYQVISSVVLPIKQSESGFGHSKLSPRISYFFSEKFVISRGYETKNIMSDIIKLSEQSSSEHEAQLFYLVICSTILQTKVFQYVNTSWKIGFQLDSFHHCLLIFCKPEVITHVVCKKRKQTVSSPL